MFSRPRDCHVTVSCRKATAEDYEAVMAINDNIYSGADYLPAKYMEFTKDPNRHMFLAEKDGRVVAFHMYYVVDDGETLVEQALRVHPDYQGQGISHQLGAFASRETLQCTPTARRFNSTTIHDGQVDKFVKREAGAKILVTRPRVSLDIIPSSLPDIIPTTAFQSAITQYSVENTHILPPSEAIKTLCNDVDLPQMLPEGVWVVDFEPMGPFASNYERIAKWSVIFITKSPGTRKIQAVSFGSWLRVKYGFKYRADFYCIQDDPDEKLMVSHVIRHLQNIHKQQLELKIAFSFFHPDVMPQKETRQILSLLGFKREDTQENNILLLTIPVAEVPTCII